MTSIENGQALEFLNQNMHRNYPIQDTCVVATADNVYLPSSFLVDCQIIIPCETQELRNGIDTSRFFVSAVMHYTNSVQVIISYQPDGSEITWDDEWVKVLSPAPAVPRLSCRTARNSTRLWSR